MSDARRVCLFAQFDPTHRIRPHVLRYVGALQQCGFQTWVACSGDRLPPLAEREALRATGAHLVFRPNRGLDFGAWRHLMLAGHADGADEILLANDSVFGPFGDLQPIIRRMQAKSYDVWGMIESRQHRWHLQSWFLHFTAAAFRVAPVQAVFALPFESMSKAAIVEQGELGLGSALRAAGLRCGAVMRHRDFAWLARRHPVNMMHLNWRYHLLSGKLPFLKADLVRSNRMNIPWAHQWDGVLRDRLGVETGPIHDYLFDYMGRTRDHPGQPYVPPLGELHAHVLAGYVLSSRDWRPALRALLGSLTGGAAEDHG
ncbi:MAG: rhamnan synthesis F family protein [Acetobacteraceae bacterium]